MSEEDCELPDTWVLERGDIKNKRKQIEPGPAEVLLANMGSGRDERLTDVAGKVIRPILV